MCVHVHVGGKGVGVGGGGYCLIKINVPFNSLCFDLVCVELGWCISTASSLHRPVSFLSRLTCMQYSKSSITACSCSVTGSVPRATMS